MLLCCCSGCLMTVSDPEAENAADIYRELHKKLPDKAVTLSAALAQVPREKHADVRIAFAQLAANQTAKEKLPTLRLLAEKARVELNVLLGFLPADLVVYDCSGALVMPAEIAHIAAAEKAALIIDGGKSEPLELLKKIRIAHAEAVARMNQLHNSSWVVHRFEYAAACIHLAQLIGVEPENLDKLDHYEKRFDNAAARRVKVENP